MRFIGPASEPSHIAVATNSSIIRLYGMASRACEAVIHGHTDMVLALDSIQTAQGYSILASGSKDCSFRLWKLQARSHYNCNSCGHFLDAAYSSSRQHQIVPKHLSMACCPFRNAQICNIKRMLPLLDVVEFCSTAVLNLSL